MSSSLSWGGEKSHEVLYLKKQFFWPLDVVIYTNRAHLMILDGENQKIIQL